MIPTTGAEDLRGAEGDAAERALLTSSPHLNAYEAQDVVRAHYGIQGVATRLASEKDETFRITASGSSYVLRVAHLKEAGAAFDLTAAALSHLAQHAPTVPVERLVRTVHQEPILRFESRAGHHRRAALTSFISGRLLRDASMTPDLLRSIGHTLAALGVGLSRFDHGAAGRSLPWDLKRSTLLKPFMAQLGPESDVSLLTSCLSRFEDRVQPSLTCLRQQIVHNDFSGDNVTVTSDRKRVSGVFDFGDLVRTQLINDVAVAATNVLGDTGDPFEPVVQIVRAYHRVVPLAQGELSLLFDLVRTRLAMRLILTEWRASRFPGNRQYILRNTPTSWRLLRQLPVSCEREESARLLAACGYR